MAAVGDDDGRDLQFRDRQNVVLCHATSPELMAGGPRHAPGAAIGDYVVPQGDKRAVFKGSTGFAALVIGFDLSHPEYTVGVGAGDRGVFVCDHGREAPPDTDFLKAAGGVSNRIGPYAAGLVAKTGHYRIGADGKPGNKVTPTISAFLLVNGFGVVYAMYGTAFPIARDQLVARAERLRVKVDGPDGKPEELKGCTLAKFKFTSKVETKAYSYPVPVIDLLGKLGEASGPTLAEWRMIQPLRQALRAGGNWTPIEAFDPPAPPELPPQRAVNVNDNSAQRSEANPPPAEDGGRDWEIDDGIPF
jgi:hypothetical protein